MPAMMIISSQDNAVEEYSCNFCIKQYEAVNLAHEAVPQGQPPNQPQDQLPNNPQD